MNDICNKNNKRYDSKDTIYNNMNYLFLDDSELCNFSAARKCLGN